MANERNDENRSMEQSEQPQKNKNRGNFANNPQRAAEAGRKGGQASHGGGRRVSE